MQTLEPKQTQAHQSQVRPLLLVLLCTLINAVSQILMKMGTAQLGKRPSMLATAIAMITVPMLFTGFVLLGISTVIYVLALRKGDLSLLYPVFTLTYVWVAALSVRILHESMNNVKIAGLAIIIGGVALLGRVSRQ